MLPLHPREGAVTLGVCRGVTPVLFWLQSGPMNYSLPLEEVLPCLCLQVGAPLGTVWPAPGTR